jgi:WD40 repeat protein
LLLAYASDDRVVRLWDTASRDHAAQPLIGHERSISAVAFAAARDGRPLLISAARDATVRIWDVATRACITTLHRRTIVGALAAMGTTVAMGDDEGFCLIELDGLTTPGSAPESAR